MSVVLGAQGGAPGFVSAGGDDDGARLDEDKRSQSALGPKTVKFGGIATPLMSHFRLNCSHLAGPTTAAGDLYGMCLLLSRWLRAGITESE